MEDLQGKVAVVTGGGSGIGRGIALAAAREGMHVALADIELDAAEGVAREVATQEVESLALQADVSDLSSMKEVADRIFDRFGAVHLLCNNAGVFTLGALTEATEADWDWLLRVNVMGVVHGLQAFVPRMRTQESESHVVNTASLAGLIAPHGLPIGVYTATKYAVVGISETLRLELEPEGIGVSVLCPGGVETRIWEAERNRPAELGGPQEMDSRAEFTGQGAAGSQLDPEEVGRMVMAGVKANDLYVMTHPETRGLVRRRFEALMAAYEGME